MANRFADVKSAAGNLGSPTQPINAFTVNPVAGDLVVVAMSSFDAIAATTHAAPTDTSGNTYTQIGTTRNVNVAGTTKLSLWYCVLTTGGSSFAVTLHATSTMSQMTGAAWLVRTPAASAYNGDAAAVAATTGTNPSSGTSTVNPVTAGSFFFGCMANSGTNTVTDGSGWNNLTPDYGITPAMLTAARLPDNATAQDLFTEYALGDVSSRAAQWTEASDTYAAIVASFAPLTPDTPGGGPVDDRWRARPSQPFTQANGILNCQRVPYGVDTGRQDPSRDAQADYFTRIC